MNRRTFFAALALAPAVLVVKPRTKNFHDPHEILDGMTRADFEAEAKAAWARAAGFGEKVPSCWEFTKVYWDSRSGKIISERIPYDKFHV